MSPNSNGAALLGRARALTRAIAAGLLLPVLLVSSTTWAAVTARPQPVSPPTFTVNTNGDATAAAPLNNGVCDTALISGQPNGICSLRAAIMKANHWPGGGVTIHLPALAPGAVYALGIARAGVDDETTGDLNISTTVTILGGGAGHTIVDGSGALDRVFSIQANAALTLSAVTVQAGHTAGGEFGGGIKADSGTLALYNSTLVGNNGGNAAGGIWNHDGLVMVYTSTISNNTANEAGGIENDNGTLVIESSTLSGNHAIGNTGGGLFNLDGGSATLVNSTISGNKTNFSGGGVGNIGSGSLLNLYNVTVANNTADADLNGTGTGGGVYNGTNPTATVSLQNTLLAGNLASINLLGHESSQPNDCSGPLSSGGYNLIETLPEACPLAGGPADQTNVPASIGPLKDNGGPTFTHALLPGSLALNAGNPGGCTGVGAAPLLADQRGARRPALNVAPVICDIGAFEFQRTFFLSLPLLQR